MENSSSDFQQIMKLSFPNLDKALLKFNLLMGSLAVLGLVILFIG